MDLCIIIDFGPWREHRALPPRLRCVVTYHVARRAPRPLVRRSASLRSAFLQGSWEGCAAKRAAVLLRLRLRLACGGNKGKGPELGNARIAAARTVHVLPATIVVASGAINRSLAR